jgi:hypothetical protein
MQCSYGRKLESSYINSCDGAGIPGNEPIGQPPPTAPSGGPTTRRPPGQSADDRNRGRNPAHTADCDGGIVVPEL